MSHKRLCHLRAPSPLGLSGRTGTDVPRADRDSPPLCHPLCLRVALAEGGWPMLVRSIRSVALHSLRAFTSSLIRFHHLGWPSASSEVGDRLLGWPEVDSVSVMHEVEIMLSPSLCMR